MKSTLTTPHRSSATTPRREAATTGAADRAEAAVPTHLDAHGHVRMVDVSTKPATARVAIARGLLRCLPSTRDALWSSSTKKGEAIVTARLAGIMAAKQTGTLIPLCHPVSLSDVAVDVSPVDDGLAIEARAACVGPTGVEMEAMVAASVAGLTLYDMGKSVERGMVLEQVRLVEKRGGKSGTWRRPGEA
ncbi:MAG: cyclic pyranopterin monophosphate synthase MoaC [Deltaproteobacteria bacterium]|nr:cyclic pyranopterin monophosphate synthase MoaC [Deltaproteobacteria bacterium]